MSASHSSIASPGAAGPSVPSDAAAPSILDEPPVPPGPPLAEPEFFRDLNLDQVVRSIIAGRDEYDLAPYFYRPLRSADAVSYRHEVMRDLNDPAVLAVVKDFAEQMREVRRCRIRAGRSGNVHQRQRWHLAAGEAYVRAVSALTVSLTSADLHSRGLSAFRDYLTEYVRGDGFRSLAADAETAGSLLAQVTYCLDLKGGSIRVTPYEGEADYSAVVERAFERFQQGAVAHVRVDVTTSPDMNHVEAGVLDLVALQHPRAFSALAEYVSRHSDFLDDGVTRFDREVQFYTGYLDLTRRLTAAGLPFCYPAVSDSKAVCAEETFDVALADQWEAEGRPVVCNDVTLQGTERVIVVSGPNQGGKTTFARTFGQLHHLGSLGLPVPGRAAALFLPDRIFTHFEKEEAIGDLRGKLEDDLVRVREILDQATPDSVVVLNEIFTSTTLDDAVLLGTRVLERLIELDLLCVCVTFVDELASLGESVVSMVSTVDPEDCAVRTYKVVRRPADGLAYALTLAERYGLTYELATRRLRR